MNLDSFLGKRRTKEYDCAAHARDVWLALTGDDLADSARGLLAAQHVGRLSRHIRHGFKRLAGPQSPCLVVFQRPGYSVHLGVYVDGGVFHLGDKSSEFHRLDFVARLFQTVTFAECQKN